MRIYIGDEVKFISDTIRSTRQIAWVCQSYGTKVDLFYPDCRIARGVERKLLKTEISIAEEIKPWFTFLVKKLTDQQISWKEEEIPQCILSRINLIIEDADRLTIERFRKELQCFADIQLLLDLIILLEKRLKQKSQKPPESSFSVENQHLKAEVQSLQAQLSMIVDKNAKLEKSNRLMSERSLKQVELMNELEADLKDKTLTTEYLHKECKRMEVVIEDIQFEKENLQKRFEDLENEKFDVDTEKRKLEYLHKALLKKHQIMERAFRKNEAKVGDVPKENKDMLKLFGLVGVNSGQLMRQFDRWDEILMRMKLTDFLPPDPGIPTKASHVVNRLI